MKKILISSFEDTLIDEEEAIDIKTILEIDRFRKAKNSFIIVSENTLDEIINYNRDFTFTDVIIALDGAVAYDLEKEKILFKNTLSMTTVKKIAKSVDVNNMEIYTIYDNLNYNDFINNPTKDILKIGVRVSTKKECEDLENIIKKNISNAITNIIKKEDNYYIEVFSKKTSRINAINKVLKDTKYDEKYIVVGSNKDIEIAEEYEAYAVSNASNSLKHIAKNNLKNVNTYGVCELLRTINEI